ncbi:hypothetical protein BK120_27010 [Paenibacillus sp. FSL A5-0031]|uniref:hypothetical protein n=1 Tax=Paenibacillus sp. FSL A5-0031 TaxID=1920420 RepID=UPI00096FC790|nr:hypothetical protein [Paenibacillus sp. FSL A5-0031]OME77181.1 hypothetical protein BK120_27010 [Paenibacillus sp. FSL A5-0031]
MEKMIWTKEKLWQGSVLASIAHAINIAHYPELANEQSWDGFNYNVQDSSGTRGTITFHSNYFVAAFRNDHSKRLSNYINAQDYFRDAPYEVKELAANETLQYLLDDVNGNDVPLITTAVWGVDDIIYSQDEMKEIIAHGGFLLDRQSCDIEDALITWKEEYEMSEGQTNLLRQLFLRKLSNPSEIITMTKDEIQMIESVDEAGLEESRTSFDEIGIQWE